MPIYEYQCKSCNHPFEIMVRGGQQPACPECGGKDLKKRWSAFAVSNAAPASPCAGGTCDLGAKSPCASGACPFSQ